MISSFFTWLVGVILKWLASRVTKEVTRRLEKIAEDKKRGRINEKNVKKYEEAKSRSEQIKAAEDLLNRV